MKRYTSPLFVLLAMAVTACASGGAPAPPTRSAAPPATKAARPQPEEEEPASSNPPSTQTLAPEQPAAGAPQTDVEQLTETDADFLGVYRLVPQPYADVMEAGGRVVNLEPMDTFFALWVPDGYETMPSRRVMVIAHGHGGNAYREMANELEFAREHGYAVVAIQWGEAEGERMFSAQQFYQFMDAALRYMAYKYDAQIDKTVYRGWSLGSGISFEVTYLDKINGSNYLALTISHDGGMRPDPEEMSVGREFTRDLYDGVYGDDAFAGAHFYLYAGEEEQIAYMKNTEQVITSFGGVVERLATDPGAGHDGFYRHPQYHEEALEIFFRLAP